MPSAPLAQEERTHIYFRTMLNPLGYVEAGISAGIDQWNNKPEEWQQGAPGYCKRLASLVGQYSIDRTANFGLATGLHEENRYFNFGKKKF